MPAELMIRFLHHKLIKELAAFGYICLRHGRWKPFLRAKRDALRMLPSMLKKRREVQGQRKVSNRYVKQILTPIFDGEYLIRKARQMING